ncbi:hypothetical protein [Bacillus toyonensis]|uniref:hypothetical protein n=1 Tax=Bacillus toyonensis TaxID=155322 RepID=UPI001C0E725E|nr:hypothetical protein [Bacillus toyonensis]MBU4643057.1 hypothetical protein [Bacillus toyonensis]
MNENFLRPAVFTKVIEPPKEEFEGLEIKPSNYLIQNVDGYNFLLCREIKQTEVEWFKEEKLFVYEGGKTYVMLANLPDEEHAMAAIRSYWRGIKELCDLTEGKQPSRENHDKYVEEAKRKNKKIAYSYGFNWHGFTYNGLKSDYCFDATIKFNTCIFVDASIDDIADYLSVSIDIQEEKLITQLDANSLFDSVEIIEFFIEDTNSKFFKKLSIEEGIALLNEFCRQAKANELPYLELTGEALAFKYVD